MKGDLPGTFQVRIDHRRRAGVDIAPQGRGGEERYAPVCTDGCCADQVTIVLKEGGHETENFRREAVNRKESILQTPRFGQDPGQAGGVLLNLR